jgi:predicted esterase
MNTFEFRRFALAALALFFTLPAFADSAFDSCRVSIADLGSLTAKNLLLVPRAPAIPVTEADQLLAEKDAERQDFVRFQLSFHVYMAGWYFYSRDFELAQLWIDRFDEKLAWLIAWGMLDLDAAGQPDFTELSAEVRDCVEGPPIYGGLQQLESGGAERSYYIKLPADYGSTYQVSAEVVATRKPLLIAFHGTGGSYQRWVGPNAYDLADVVGEEAIMVFPNALPDANGSPQWSYAVDFGFFEDLLADLDARGVEYDPNRVFVTGHSSGGGFAHEIGCRYGDIVRAIAPSAGALISGSCVGSVAVLMSQGVNDSLVDVNIARATRDFWAKYNSRNPAASVAGSIAPCVIQNTIAPGSADYPVVWCEHGEGSLSDFSGHAWATFTSQAVWDFFSGLSAVEPSFAEPPGGGNAAVLADTDTTMTFTLRYPPDIARVISGAITLYPESYLENPTFAIPSVFLNTDWSPGIVAPGDTVTYVDVPITFFVFFGDPVIFPSTWTLQISTYVEGGTSPVPTDCLDHKVLMPITFIDKTTAVVIPGVLNVEPVQPIGGSCEP